LIEVAPSELKLAVERMHGGNDSCVQSVPDSETHGVRPSGKALWRSSILPSIQEPCAPVRGHRSLREVGTTAFMPRTKRARLNRQQMLWTRLSWRRA